MGNRRHALKSWMLAGLIGSIAGLADCGREASGTGPDSNPNPNPDSGKTDTVPGRKGLARLAAAMHRLPMPMGTRYFAAHSPAPKAAAALACRGEQDIFAIPSNPRGILGLDTVTYLDSLGIAHCLHQEPTIREDHARSLFDPACGQAWERIRIEIIPDDLLPRYRSHGTGRLRLISGLEAEIEAYEMDMALDNSTGMAVIQDAHLRLAASDGHVLQFDLVKSHPFRDVDFYPSWDDSPAGAPVMGGPVLFGTDTVGRAMLYDDRTVGFLDAAGKPVAPE